MLGSARTARFLESSFVAEDRLSQTYVRMPGSRLVASLEITIRGNGRDPRDNLCFHTSS
jgi:hypothetical protein